MKLHTISKKVLIIAISGVLAISMYSQSIPVAAATTTSYSKSTIELMKKFPNFQESLAKNTTGKIAASSEVYVKIQKKEDVQAATIANSVYDSNTLEKDFNVSYYTRDEFEKQNVQATNVSASNIVTTFGIGKLEINPCSWMRLDLQVAYGSGQSYYMVYNFCSWLTKPVCRFTDGIGISLSPGLVLSGDASTRGAEFLSGDDILGWEGEYYKRLTVTSNPQGNGVLATFGLPGPSTYGVGEYINTMISTGVNYSGPGTSEGWITGHYMHKQIAFGGISMDAKGVPSVGLSLSDDLYSGGIHVAR